MSDQPGAGSQASPEREREPGSSPRAGSGAADAARTAIGRGSVHHPQPDLLTEALRRWAWEGGALDRPSE